MSVIMWIDKERCWITIVIRNKQFIEVLIPVCRFLHDEE